MDICMDMRNLFSCFLALSVLQTVSHQSTIIVIFLSDNPEIISYSLLPIQKDPLYDCAG